MSIRKRLFISNTVMVVMPVIILIVLVFLVGVIFSDYRGFNDFHNGWQDGSQETDELDDQLFDQLIKTTSIDQEKLFDDQYLRSIEQQINIENGGIIIRKEEKLLYASDRIDSLSSKDLPPFGNEGYDPVAWFGQNQYSVKQHDFYFRDGSVGSIFLLNEAGSFIQFARSFFPLLFIGLLLILVLTNVLLSYLMSKSILKPVDKLSDAAAKISEGNLDFTIHASGKDELSRLVNSFDDMRARLKTSLELREQYEMNRKELIANISHDLKTPITSIRGYVEGIKDGVANTVEKYDRYLNTIQAKAQHMDHMIDELFLYSKLDLKRVPFHFEEVDIKAFLEDYLDELQLELSEQNVELTLKIQSINAVALIDRDKLIRVMNNIIYNSVKYADKSKCLINIDLKDSENMVEVVISDNGPGIPLEEISTIFNRFYRGDPSRNTNTGGSGLGLAIAAQIIDAHGGSIWAESTQGEGLTIHFTLNKREDEGDEHEQNPDH
ncbi:cell wall metabolism sensor histidine kinase WalK [Alkalihalobacillus sp. AL-G]|uniref:sensor histidine kinase n=1 Tax=Alkalihalobacillus sp. AL-G TaxID=2926399 RepID=UPI00272DC5FE|nr:HAMP domain-containing sensor histidine kinase [Alkalihalobacillus sp. AL-G]WLD91674.1 HAMP domain-containing histidine kinase [Alkalihalobacillus sp. AL-G]